MDRISKNSISFQNLQPCFSPGQDVVPAPGPSPAPQKALPFGPGMRTLGRSLAWLLPHEPAVPGKVAFHAHT